ncbi:hypothetical protein BS78_03G073700 [Paspalum vaginatum]|nr:hypothetical protein BS78_03G073700 [Paspalum vaginatum]
MNDNHFIYYDVAESRQDLELAAECDAPAPLVAVSVEGGRGPVIQVQRRRRVEVVWVGSPPPLQRLRQVARRGWGGGGGGRRCDGAGGGGGATKECGGTGRDLACSGRQWLAERTREHNTRRERPAAARSIRSLEDKVKGSTLHFLSVPKICATHQ